MFEPEECMTAQDSTTREQTLCFSHGDDFLFQLKDDKYYHGTVVEVHFQQMAIFFKSVIKVQL